MSEISTIHNILHLIAILVMRAYIIVLTYVIVVYLTVRFIGAYKAGKFTNVGQSSKL